MKHKNELDRLIRNLYLIKNTNLNNMEEVVQKVGEKSLNIQQDKKVLTSQKNEQAITHGQ